MWIGAKPSHEVNAQVATSLSRMCVAMLKVALVGVRTMGISLPLFAAGLLLATTGVVLLAIRKQRRIAVLCLLLGVALAIVPPVLLMLSPM